MIRILKCDHYDVKSGTLGRYVRHMEGGIAVEVDGEFHDAYSKKQQTRTETVFVSAGDYEPL